MLNQEQKQEQKSTAQTHESFEGWLFSEENQGALAFFIICVTFTIWYFFHMSNMAIACVANGGF